MKESPFVSIIIPTYNRSGLLPETLDSILNQTDHHWECLLVDDGSTDETWSVLQNYATKDSRFKIFKRQDFNKPKGANACRNIGIQNAKGDYLIFFDSDDLMLPDCISEHFKNIHHSTPDLSILQSEYFGEGIEQGNPVIVGDIHSSELVEKFFQKEIVWLTHNPAISKIFLQKNSIIFDENLQAAQDWEFFMKIILRNPKIISSDYIGTKMRTHKNTISKNLEGKAKKYFHYYKARNIIFNQYLNDIQRNKLRNYYKTYSETMMRELTKMGKYDRVKEIIQNETNGFPRIFNLFFLSIYKVTKKGLSKINLS